MLQTSKPRKVSEFNLNWQEKYSEVMLTKNLTYYASASENFLIPRSAGG